MAERMRRLAAGIAAGAAALALCGPALGHHSYAEFDRDRAVTIEGTLASVAWANPHIRLTIVTEDAITYEVQWGNVRRLERAGVAANPFAVGDHLVITGAAHRDPAQRVLTLLESVARPADGWSWSRRSRFDVPSGDGIGPRTGPRTGR
jgi:hypothetical protein